MAIWIADGKKGLIRDGQQVHASPCYALARGWGKMYASLHKSGLCLDEEEILFDFPLPPGAAALFPFGEHLCALSSESDCVWALSPGDGSLCISAPAGSYPRFACVSPCGRHMAVAGGGAGEVVLFDREFHCLRRLRVAGAAVGLCFLPRALAVLCAVGEEKITSRLLIISSRGVTEELCACPQAPCCMLALPGGRMLMGVHGQVVHLDANGRTVGRTACVYPSRMRLTGNGPLFTDVWQGGLYNLQGRLICPAPEPEDFFVT